MRSNGYMRACGVIVISSLISGVSLFAGSNPVAVEKDNKVVPPAAKAEAKPASKDIQKGDAKDSKVLYTLDFAKASKDNKDARKWIEKEGFTCKSAASSQSKINFSFKDNALNVKSISGIFGIILKETTIKGATKVRITWGVNKFPKGASYKNGVNNEALMLYVYFGTKKLDSGSMFIPNSPYFMGLFLGEDEDLDKPCIGKHFKEGGRFICVGKPKAGETVTTVFNLKDAFLKCFTKEKSEPEVTAFALEVETSDSGDADAFIKKIEFLN